MQLQQEKDLELARIDAQKTVVGANAQALGEALSTIQEESQKADR